MVEHQLPKLDTRVRFPSPAPILYFIFAAVSKKENEKQTLILLFYK